MTQTSTPATPECDADAHDASLTELRTLELDVSDAARHPLLVVVQRYAETLTVCVLNLAEGLLVGRELGAGLRLRGTLVSRRHALLRAAAGGLEVEDLSRNGTLVNGLPLHRGRMHVSGDCTLIIGSNRVRLRRL